MPIPPGVARWTLTGQLTVDEVWAFDWWTQPGTGVASAAAWQATVDALHGVAQGAGLYTALATMIGAPANIKTLKGLYYRNAQTAEYVGQHDLSPAVPGSASTYAPNQVAACVTTLTDHPTRRTRGRLYLPANAMSIDSNHWFIQSVLTNVVTKLATVIGAGHTDGQYGPPVVVSQAGTLATPMNRLRFDLRPDIQRRRANRQATGPQTVIVIP